MNVQDELKLKELNDAVTNAIKYRRDWLDSKMEEYAKFKVGDDIYNVQALQKIGVVRRLYRYWSNRNDGVMDTSMDINYEYKIVGTNNSFSNTSSQPNIHYGAKEDMLDFSKRLI